MQIVTERGGVKQSSRNRGLLSRSADFLYSIDGNPLAAATAVAEEEAHLDPEAPGHRDHPAIRSHRDARCALAKSLIPTDATSPSSRERRERGVRFLGTSFLCDAKLRCCGFAGRASAAKYASIGRVLLEYCDRDVVS